MTASISPVNGIPLDMTSGSVDPREREREREKERERERERKRKRQNQRGGIMKQTDRETNRRKITKTEGEAQIRRE